MVNKSQENSDLQQKPPVDFFVVKGRILVPDGTPYIGGIVRAFDQGLRHEQALGQDTRTLKDGGYEIKYTSEQFSRAEKKRADLIVRVFDQNGKKLLASSKIIFNAHAVETIDLVVSEKDVVTPSEYEQLLTELEPLLSHVKVEGARKPTIFQKLADLKEDKQQQEMTFLARESGVERQRIVFLVHAARLSIQTKLQAEVFYGLFRQGIPTNLFALLGQKVGVIRSTLKAAVSRKVIPEFNGEKELDHIIDSLKELRLKHHLEEPVQSGKASFGELLEMALPQRRGKQEAFLKCYLEHQDQEEPVPIEHFWQSLRQDEEFKNDIDTLQFTLQASTLTQNHLPLVKELQNLRREGKLQTPRDWAGLDEEAWARLILKQQTDGQPVGFPPDVPGKDNNEKTKNYAAMMARAIENAFPTPVIAHHLEKQNREEDADVVKFFRSNQDFEFRKISVDAYVEQHSHSVLEGLQDPAGTVKTLKSMQRLFKVTPRYEEMQVLLDGGLFSAHDITSLGKDAFVEQYGASLGGVERTLDIINAACQVEAMSIVFYSSKSSHFRRTDVQAIDAGDSHADAMAPGELNELGIAAPTWKKLFGSLDLCDCEHCRSAYSPAAYLVDILAFLKKRYVIATGQRPLSILNNRRPDLGALDLSCENTNTILPYVDLVNEVLEDAIEPLPHFRPFTIRSGLKEDLDNRFLSRSLKHAFRPYLSNSATIVVLNTGREWRILDTSYAYSVLDEDPADDFLQVVARGWQTYATSEELRANPQYTNPEAYSTVARAVYPWHLPFDRWITEGRTYLKHLGLERYNLMQTFQSQGATPHPDENAIACEYLGLTPVEWQILNGSHPVETSPASAWEYWGYPATPAPGDWVEEQSLVSTFLQTSGLTYLELLQLLSTRFINVDGILHIETNDSEEDLATCDLTKLRITNLDRYTLDRTHRFVRLWRAIGWSMPELDKAIHVLKPVGRSVDRLNVGEWTDILRRLSSVQRLKNTLKVPLVRMLSWWALIDTDGYNQLGKQSGPSLYDELFQNKAVFDSSDDLYRFKLNNDRNQLDNPETSISGASPAICAALEISSADLSLITAEIADIVVEESTADKLNLENLSYVFRVVSLAKALKLTIKDFLSLRSLFGVRPLLDPLRLVAVTSEDERVYPGDTLQWIEILDNIRSSDFTIPDLSYLLRYEDGEAHESVPGEETISSFLSELRDGMKTIIDEQMITPDPAGDVTRQKLLLLQWEPALVEEVIATLNNGKIFSVSQTDPFPVEVPLAMEELPPALTNDEKAALKRKVSLKVSEDGTHMLLFQGVMSENEKDALLSLSSETDYRIAIENLFDGPRAFVATRMKAFEQTVSVSLEDLPREIVFPEQLKHKVSYDTSTRQLCYNGVMTEEERDIIYDLSDVPAYHSAIDELFTASTSTLDPDDENAFLKRADAEELLLEPEDNPESRVPERFRYVLERVVSYLQKALGGNLIKQMFSDALGLNNEITSQLLTRLVNAATAPGQKAIEDFLNVTFLASQSKLTTTAFPKQFLTFRRLHKIATAIGKLQVSADQVAWIFENAPDLDWLNLAELPVQPDDPDASFDAWLKLINGLLVFEQLPSRETTLFDFLDLIRSFESFDGSVKQNYFSTLAQSTGWSLADIEVLAGKKDDMEDTGALNLAFPNDFQTETALSKLISCFKLLRQIGVSAQELETWVQPVLSFESARSIRQAVKAKYDYERWLVVAKPLRDVLREKQRDALVAYLVHHADIWLSADEIATLQAAGQQPDANKLYAHFLLDVEMSACMMTSRIKQACSSVQLFVQRCQMGLEEGLSLGKEADRQWTWMKNYRVWEANRKVFLYPENWIYPELRDDKTPFFKDLENELMQNEVNEDTAEKAFLNYLEKLDAVAHLEICGVYHQLETGINILHVFGRTEGQAHVYYYRQYIDNSCWTAWEEVKVDIEGDHLVPVVHEGRLKLFWPIFTEKQEEVYDEDVEPPHYWEIQLACSEYKDGKWTAKNISKEEEKITSQKLTIDEFWRDICKKEKYVFKALQWGHNLAILCFKLTGDPELSVYVGVFLLAGCRNEILTQGMLEPISEEYIKHGIFQKQIPYPLINQNTTPIYEAIIMWHEQLAPDRCHSKNNSFEEDGQDFSGSIEDALNLTSDYYLLPKIPTLGKTPGTFELLYQHQLQWYQYQLLQWVYSDQSIVKLLRLLLYLPEFQFLRIPSSFFYKDNFKNFFVIPVTQLQGIEVFGEDGVSPASLLGYPIDYGDEVMPDLSNDAGIAGESELRDQIARAVTQYFLGGMDNNSQSVYLFKVFYHPYICHFIKTLNREGIDGLLQRNTQLLSDDFFESDYDPKDAVIRGNRVEVETLASLKEVYELYPRDEVDFNFDGTYAQYNWELFFHAPLLIAERLSSNQRFAEAQKWFHYIFDPTDSSDDAIPKRYWQMRPLYETTDEQYQSQEIRKLLRDLAGKTTEPGKRARLENQVKQWRKNPFNPHLLARFRTTAFQKSVVIKYIDNLIAWGDYLFRQDTIESINEATQLYILVAEILGARPQKILARSTPPTKTVKDLIINPDLDEFSNLLEEALPPAYSVSGVTDTDGSVPISLGSVLYFCVPKNDKLLEHWDTVEDRLFKIRHCMNIEGVVRELPLFQPPIEPGLLVKAVAAGIDIGSVLNDLNAPLPYYRFQVLLQKALELCNDLKALGASLLSALEKRDAEALALRRSSQEIALLNSVSEVKEYQVDEAKETLKSAEKSRDVVKHRKDYYNRLLTNTATLSVSAGRGDFRTVIKPLYPVNEFELLHLLLAGGSIVLQGGAAAANMTSATMFLIPDTEGGAPTTAGFTLGGSNIGQSIQSFGGFLSNMAGMSNTAASLAATMGSYKRRAEEWNFQKQLAEKELAQFEQAGGQNGPQILAAQARVDIAEKDLANHELQIENARAVDAYMREKFTNQELYGWMIGQISTIYFQTYKLAYDLAKRAEKCFRYELGLDDSNFIKFGYWDSLKKGLLAGERLHHDLKRMEMAYLAQNKREYELSKSISLAMLDPVALFELREKGECFFFFPEALFDLDHPGHYLRRIKAVSITIPCVTGPYTNVSATLTLQSNRIRKKTLTTPRYKWSGDFSDDRFNYNFGGIQSISTSSSQNDSGLFELNFRDDRYIPFEYAGVISNWHLQLPKDFRQFDYKTITDIVIHLRYTAREGGAALKKSANDEIANLFEEHSSEVPLILAFSLKHDFPSEWHHFLYSSTGEDSHSLYLDLNQKRFPHQFSSKVIQINSIQVFLRLNNSVEYDEHVERLSMVLKNPDGDRPYEEPDPEFSVSGSLIENMPYLEVVFDDGQTTGVWLFEIPGIDPADDSVDTRKSIPAELRHPDNPAMLNPDAIEDMLVICKYRISS